MNIYRMKYSPSLREAFVGFSQFHEDFYFSRIFAGRRSGVCVDVGANDGTYGSNSAYLEQQGWKCVLVEPNDGLCEEILKNRKPYKLFQCVASAAEGEVKLYKVSGGPLAHGLSTVEPSKENIERITDNNFTYEESLVSAKTLDSILLESCVDGIDVLSIDVEGHEMSVLRGVTLEKWVPRIIVIEDNSYYKSNNISSHLALHGYVKFFRSGVNDWYAKESDKEFVNPLNSLFYSVEKWSYLTWTSVPVVMLRRSFSRFRRKFFAK